MEPLNIDNDGFTESSSDAEDNLDFFRLEPEKESLQKLNQVSKILQTTYLENKGWSGKVNVIATLITFQKLIKAAKSALDISKRIVFSTMKWFEKRQREAAEVDAELEYLGVNGKKLRKIYTNLTPLFELVCQEAKDSILSAASAAKDEDKRTSPNTLQSLLKIKTILENAGVFFNTVKEHCDEMVSLVTNCQSLLNKKITNEIIVSKVKASMILWESIHTICDAASDSIDSAEIVTDKIIDNLENKPKTKSAKSSFTSSTLQQSVKNVFPVPKKEKFPIFTGDFDRKPASSTEEGKLPENRNISDTPTHAAIKNAETETDKIIIDLIPKESTVQK